MPHASPRRSHQGFTLIEMLVAIVIIGIGLAGLLKALSVTTANSADPLVRKQLQALADQIMEEVLLKPYEAAANAAPAKACARNTYNDVSDYAGYETVGKVCDVDGDDVAQLPGFSLKVTVAADTLGGVTDTKRVTVLASRGSESFELIGWRTWYAK